MRSPASKDNARASARHAICADNCFGLTALYNLADEGAGPRGTTERKVPVPSDRCGQYRCSGRSTGRDPMPGSRPTWYLTDEYVGRDQTFDLQELQVASLTVPLFLGQGSGELARTRGHTAGRLPRTPPRRGPHRLLPARLVGTRGRGAFAFTPEDFRHRGPSPGRAST